MMTFLQFKNFVQRRLDRQADVRLNDNLHDVVTVIRPKRGPLRVSVHHMFLEAQPDAIEMLIEFIQGPTERSRREIRRHICENRHRIRSTPTRRRAIELQPAGQHFHLRRLADRINRHYFDGRLKFGVTWGRRPDSPPPDLSHIQLGNWNDSLRLIRIHPILDCAITPVFFVEYVLYHEMVHIISPPELDAAGRIRHHTRRFYALEKRFEDYERAVKWQDDHINELIHRYCSRPRKAFARQLRLF